MVIVFIYLLLFSFVLYQSFTTGSVKIKNTQVSIFHTKLKIQTVFRNITREELGHNKDNLSYENSNKPHNKITKSKVIN